MGKRLRRDTEELDASTSFDIDSNLAASISQDEPCEQNNIRQPQKYAIPTACDSKGYGIAIQCTLPPHQPTSFLTQSDFETHYQKDHANRCSACSKNFPTEHYMYLHIAENHDPINEVLKQSNARIYGCFVEGCDRKCSTPQKRRRHLIDKHLFPKNYDFYIVNDGLDNRISLLRADSGDSKASVTTLDSKHSKSNLIVATDLETGLPEKPERSRILSAHAIHKLKLSEDPKDNDYNKARNPAVSDADRIVSSMSALDLVPRSLRLHKTDIKPT